MSLVFRRGVSLLRLALIQTSTISNVQRRAASEDVSLDLPLMREDQFDSVIPVRKKNDALLPVDKDDIQDIAPELRPTFNLAAYVNKSTTLQEMVHLGVDLTRWEKSQNISSYVLGLDFENDMKKHILFLHDIGVSADDLGRWLSVSPFIFKQDIGDLQTRYNYLLSKQFDQLQISRIVTRNPHWLLFSTVDIDERLGFFQRTFKLSNSEVRYLAVKQPRVITYKMYSLKRTNFALIEEMGFSEDETKSLLLAKPKLWMTHGVSLMRRFDYAHNMMGLTHSQIVDFPKILTSRDFRLKQRHGFLKLIGRDQFDGTKPNYVSPDALIDGDDVEFCTNVAKTSVIDFNNYLKTI